LLNTAITLSGRTLRSTTTVTKYSQRYTAQCPKASLYTYYSVTNVAVVLRLVQLNIALRIRDNRSLLRLGEDPAASRELTQRGIPGQPLLESDRARIELKPLKAFQPDEVVAFEDADSSNTLRYGLVVSSSDDELQGDAPAAPAPAATAPATAAAATERRSSNTSDTAAAEAAAAASEPEESAIKYVRVKTAPRSDAVVTLKASEVYSFKPAKDAAAAAAASATAATTAATGDALQGVPAALLSGLIRTTAGVLQEQQQQQGCDAPPLPPQAPYTAVLPPLPPPITTEQMLETVQSMLQRCGLSLSTDTVTR
jgi:hypothetical protein